MHPLNINGYPFRKYRGNEFSETETIQIISILCTNAKKQGKQYTQRLLPDFLMPRCQIRLDKATDAYQETFISHDIDKACIIMAAIDPRTAIKHLFRINDVLKKINLSLSESIVQIPECGELPEIPPDTSTSMKLLLLHKTQTNARLRSGDTRTLPGTLKLIQKELWKFFHRKPTGCDFPNSRSP